ncbi:hypothetical protein FC91_GL001797 [Schleiferilactobacillus harbinensis DSM 16991]|uniref:Uncharacterized protein n=1 Tax=Schleiferilactobacillus harbinensis DSM 16991 TaxID=1122147 RepID=A0A0R1XE65_9LACO|nr:hypothetical protein FC91_GL001797 [Schleiferilactobacillus harbinensis DSM 16991]
MTRRTIGAQNEIRLSNMKNTATKLNTAISCMVSGLIDMHSHLFLLRLLYATILQKYVAIL